MEKIVNKMPFATDLVWNSMIFGIYRFYELYHILPTTLVVSPGDSWAKDRIDESYLVVEINKNLKNDDWKLSAIKVGLEEKDDQELILDVEGA